MKYSFTESLYLCSSLLSLDTMLAIALVGSSVLSISRWLTPSKTVWWTGCCWFPCHLKQPWKTSGLKLQNERAMVKCRLFDIQCDCWPVYIKDDPLILTKMNFCPWHYSGWSYLVIHSDGQRWRKKVDIYDLHLDMSKFYGFLWSTQGSTSVITKLNKKPSV